MSVWVEIELSNFVQIWISFHKEKADMIMEIYDEDWYDLFTFVNNNSSLSKVSVWKLRAPCSQR